MINIKKKRDVTFLVKMGKTKTKIFDINAHFSNEGTSKKCLYYQRTLKGNLIYNLKRHIISLHKEVAIKIGLIKK